MRQLILIIAVAGSLFGQGTPLPTPFVTAGSTAGGGCGALGGDVTGTCAATVLANIPSGVQDSITRLGTIASGVWHGTAVGVQYGGSGADLSATGGSNQFVKQVSVGGALTVGTAALANLSDGAGAVIGAANLDTAGYVPYVSAAGTLSIDKTSANQLFYDSTNHYLGMGTASPASRFHISGLSGNTSTLTLQATTNAGGVSSGVLKFISSLATKTYYMAVDGSSGLYLFDLTRSATAMNISTLGLVTFPNLATTGAATGKTIVCADTAGALYRSTSGVACAN